MYTGDIKDSAVGLFAGINGGIASVFVGQPLDTIKVKLQTFPEVYCSAWKCFRATLAKDGLFRGLYAGTSPALMANVGENAILFCALPPSESLVSWLCDVQEKHNLSVLQHACAGSLASFWSSLVLCPAELIKCKVQSLREMAELGQLKSTEHMSTLCVTKSIFNEQGLRGFTNGLGATFAREMPGYFFFFGGYEACRSLLTPSGGSKDQLSNWATAFSGGVGGVLLWLAIFPFDLVKSRMQIGHVDTVKNTNIGKTDTVPLNRSTNMLKVLFHIAECEGIAALYRGLGPTILRTFPCSAALFLTVEWTRGLLL